MDVVSLYLRAADSFGSYVKGIGSDQWDLPTPCADWNVRALLNHLVGEDLWAEPMLAGTTIAEVGDKLDGDLLGDDPVSAWEKAAAEARRVITAPDALAATVHASFAELTGEVYISQLFHDHLIHGWDLAKAIGADTTIDSELVQIVYDQLAPIEDMLKASGAFGEKIVPPAGADTQTKLLAIVGRRA